MERDEFLEKLEVELRIAKNSLYTIRNYLSANKEFLEATTKPLVDLSSDDVKLFLSKYYANKSSSSTSLFLAALRFSFSTLLDKDITLKVRRPKKDTRLPSVLSRDQVKLLLSCITHEKSRLMVSLIYACGLRVSELGNLQKSDINLSDKSGVLRQAKGRKDRSFMIPDFLFDEIKALVESNNPSNFLFPGRSGKISDRNVQKIIATAAKKAGLTGVHTHTLRHSYATHLLEDGVDIRKIQELLGHANLATTQVYTHVSTEELRKVKSPIDSF